MNLHSLIALMLLVNYVAPTGTAAISAESVVRKLYGQITTRKPLGIPKGSDETAIRPLLGKELLQTLRAAQSCQDDYFRQHIDKGSKPEFGWLETGIFSGPNERAIPSAAVVERTEPQEDGSFHVYVRLTYRESFDTYGRAPNPANTFSWQVAAVAKSEGGHFVVTDVLFFEGESKKIESRLSDSFRGCEGSHWVGDKNS